jgi:hypothetical protein
MSQVELPEKVDSCMKKLKNATHTLMKTAIYSCICSKIFKSHLTKELEDLVSLKNGFSKNRLELT